MLLTTQRVLATGVIAAVAALTNSAAAQTTVTAVNFGGDLISGNNNSSLDESGQVVKDFGDFDGDTNTDARFTIPIDHDGLFFGTNDPIDPSNNAFWNTGLEIINYGQATPSDGSVGAVFRLNGSGRTNDRFQAGSAPSTGTSTGLVFAPHVRKANFLNGANGGETVSFTDDANGFFWDWQWQTGAAFAPKNTTLSRQTRATVKNGSTWYLSDTVSSVRGNGVDDGISFNPATATWYEWDVDTTLFFDDVSAGVGVLGSTFTDIQSIGAVMMLNADTNTANNGIVANIDQLNVSLDFTTPPDPEPVPGFALVDWDMDNLVTNLTTDDQFGNTFVSDGFVDVSMTPNPTLLGGDTTDPLLLGDATPSSGDRFPVSTRPVQTAGGMGVGGEALQFDGINDEALGITAWAGDTSEELFIPGLEGVYVEVDFKEDANTGNGTQNIVGARTVWELRIDNDGNLEWATWLEGGGNDIIEVPLGEEGEWRNVQAFHNPDGSKGLILDGELVASSSTNAQLRVDRRSIAVGSQENADRFYAGLIDNVFVGSGVVLDSLPGDANGDGTVDLLDLDILGANFGAMGAGGASIGDFNGDGTVDLLDLDILGANFGSSGSAAIPEPSTIVLVGLGCVALSRGLRKQAR